MLRVKKIISWATRHLLCDKYQTFKSPSIVVKINSKQLLLFPYLFQYVTMNDRKIHSPQWLSHPNMKHPRPKRMRNATELTFKGKNKHFVVKCYRLKYGCYINGKQFVRNQRSNGIQKTSVSKKLINYIVWFLQILKLLFSQWASIYLLREKKGYVGVKNIFNP